MKIDLKSDRSEHVRYNNADLPLYLQKGLLSSYPNYAAECHWHDDIEFIVVLSGKMQYNINGQIVTLEAGNGIFVNSRQFHFGYSDTFTECKFLCVILHPVSLCVSHYIEQSFIAPILDDVLLPYHLLHSDTDWENRIINALCDMFEAEELKIISLFFDIWNELYKHKGSLIQNTFNKNSKLNILKKMISFIQNNYKEKINLSDIANTGSVGKTECCIIFKRYTNLTPILYLNDYRLRKSVKLLTETDLTISEICYEVGFSGASYFTEIFSKTFHCTPKAYRLANK